MFPDELISALHQRPISTVPIQAGFITPFRVVQLAETQILLHLIDINTYVRFRHQHDSHFFFQQFSETLATAGRQVIHLWEDVWRQKPAIVLSRLNALVGLSERIPARLTQIRRVDRPTATQFLEDNHLQVVTLSKYRYGLYLPQRYFRVLSPEFRPQLPVGETELLVALATFSLPRRIEREEKQYRSVELVRFANRLGCTVVGGLDKLLKGFITEHQPDDIMTYADRDWSDGRSYGKLGFTRIELTEPQQFWLHPEEMLRYYPHRLPTEVSADQLLPVYNAGSIKFVKLLI
ncbi:hypothetical protein GCM10023187_36130 [Nibrella viscosa]|uniref:N-acetyltransferase domain-containing protein n=1 Tax=Nibrella viscosa TaxID=1084524 RepID=A0ABP8KNL1_9BACT